MKNYLFLWLVFFGLLLLRPVTYSQTPNKITLQQAMDMAEKNYPSIKAKESALQASSYHLSAVKNAYIPDLILQDQDLFATANSIVGAYYSNGGTAIPISGSLKSNTYQGVWSSFATLLVDWKAFNFGKLRTDVQIASGELKFSSYDYDNEVFQLKIKVADAYLLLIALEQLQNVQQKNLNRAQSFYQMTYAYSHSGMKAGVDSSVARAELSKANLLYLQSQNNVDIQRYNLMSLIGVKQEFSTDTSIFLSRIPMNSTLDSTALSNNPLLKLYSTQTDIFRLQAKAIGLSYLPSIHILGAGWGRGSGIREVSNNYILNSGISEGLPFESYNYMVGASFVWNLGSAPRTYNEYKSQLMQANEAQYNYDRVYIESREALNEANLSYEHALEEVRESPIQYRAALDAYNQSKSRYDAGLSTYYEISQALYVLNRAEADLLASYNNLWRSVLKQAASAGDINLFINKIK